MMLLHASLAFISMEIRICSEFCRPVMGMGEQNKFLAFSVSLGLLPPILGVSEMSLMEIFSDRLLILIQPQLAAAW